MELVSEAIAFAVKAHDGMRRKKSEAPYILHPMEAAVVVGTMTDDQNLIAAAALHDVVEDANITIDEIEEKFGKRVRELVESETEDKRADLPPESTWRIRKEESLAVLKNTEDTRMLRRALRRSEGADSPARIARCKEMLEYLLNKVDTLVF